MIRSRFGEAEIATGIQELENDPVFRRKLASVVGTTGSLEQQVDRLLSKKRNAALKYVGIELDQPGSRFSYSDTVRLLVAPRSQDGKGQKSLKVSAHGQAFRKELPEVARLFEDPRLVGLCNDAVNAAVFERSRFAEAVRPALAKLEQLTGVPPKVALQVLKKGAFAYGSSHRPSMTRFGWARARLSAVLFKGCAHFSPDHGLVEEAKRLSPQAVRWWAAHPQCLCVKRGQCNQVGKSVPANGAPRRRASTKEPALRIP